MSRGTMTRKFFKFSPLIVLLSLACLGPPWIGSYQPWFKAEEFVDNLRCNMKESDIEDCARYFPRLDLHKPDYSSDVLVAQKGDTRIRLELKDEKLQKYQIYWTSGLTKLSFRLKRDLCTGLDHVVLQFVGGEELAGGNVLLDDTPLGQLDENGGIKEDISLGAHRLRVEKPGVGAWVTDLYYDESSSGYHRLSATLMTKQNEI